MQKNFLIFLFIIFHIIERRYLIYTKDLKKDEEPLLIPVYMIQFL